MGILPLPSPTAILFEADARRWACFSNPLTTLDTRQIHEVLPILQQVERKVSQEKLYAVGFLSYEAAPAFDSAFSTHRPCNDFPLIWFGLFKDFGTVHLTQLSPNGYKLSNWKPSVTRKEYDQAIGEIKNAIARGDTYQVNYTLRLTAEFSGDPLGFFLQLASAQRAKYLAYLDIGNFVICSASPELFFEYSKGHVVCRPMKGTAKRGLWYEDDQKKAEELFYSVKNRAENVMIVDMIRNDLGRIARIGSVKTTRLFEVERYPTVWQMTSTVEADTSASISEVLGALFPCASITGAPKVSTMEIISRLETRPRQIYTGAIGLITPQNCARFNVAIRTVLIDRRSGTAEYGVGGGIVWDSTPEGEYEECQIKAQFLTYRNPDFDLLETLRWTPQEGYFLLEQHLERLRQSAAYFDFAYDGLAIKEALLNYARSLSSPQRVRLTLKSDGALAIQSAPLSNPIQTVRLVLAKKPISSQNPFLYHKTTYRQVYETARREAQVLDPNCEVLLWNERGEITESEISNIVVRIEGRLWTPPISCGLLPGVFRRCLIERNEIQEKVIRIEDLPRCEEIFLINSVRQWRRGMIEPGGWRPL
ncbi:MAG: aminodeoxychorismate synthase component I [Anaerolineales bacterium]|nr:aminodeoxychorismate synthase component I [Anaerolineales bacterium]MDW8447057.1 aminodeoxychorismate synthase component I [Anaerolineales bacterium]